MKLYGICLERSINCFLCFPGSHKYSSFAGWALPFRPPLWPSRSGVLWPRDSQSVSYSPIQWLRSSSSSGQVITGLSALYPSFCWPESDRLDGLSILQNQGETNITIIMRRVMVVVLWPIYSLLLSVALPSFLPQFAAVHKYPLPDLLLLHCTLTAPLLHVTVIQHYRNN